jgi:ATP-dependent Clp protease ATP-binding subunit ClpC
MKGLIDELKTNKDYILFIDDIHSVLSDKNRTSEIDVSSMLSNALSEGDIQVIGTTNYKNYRNTFDSNTSLARKFQKIVIEPSTISESIEILENIKNYYEDYHKVTYTKEAIVACVELSRRYFTDKVLPSSAIDLLDESGVMVGHTLNEPTEIIEKRIELNKIKKEKLLTIKENNSAKIKELEKAEEKLKIEMSDLEYNYNNKQSKIPVVVDSDVILSLISEKTGIPITRLNSDEKKKLSNINNVLKESVVGQDEAVNKVSQALKRSRVGLSNPNRPNGVFMFCGATGVGKTFLAKQIAKEIFGSENYLVRFDMSEYSDQTSVNKLIGAGAGFVGFENGGSIELVDNQPHSVVVLDEIEKSSTDVLNLFLAIFDEGNVTTNMGKKVSFKNTIIILTSNIGVKAANEAGNGIGFNSNASEYKTNIIEKELKRKFPPEFINRLDDIIYFNTLTDENYKDIIKLELNKFINKIEKLNLSFEYNDSVVDYIFSIVKNEKEFGARPILRTIQREIENKITDLLIENEYINHTFVSYITNEKLEIK